MKKTLIELIVFAASWCVAIPVSCGHIFESSVEIDSAIVNEILSNIESENRSELFGAVNTPAGQKPGPKSLETNWTRWLAEGNDLQDFVGEAEKKTVDGSRVDIYTNSGYAIEVEWASKWKEAIGQSLYYATLEDAKPGIILLFKGDQVEKFYYMRLMVVASKYGIKVWVVETK